MRGSKSISLFTLLFWSLFINSRRFFLIIIISFTIIFSIIISSMMPQTNLNIGIVNLDKGLTLQFSSNSLSFSDQIIESLKKQCNNIKNFNSIERAVKELNNGRISLILYFPENYTLFTHLANFSKNSNVKPRIFIYANEKKFAKEIKLELFTAFSDMVESKIIPLEIVETITNKQIPSNYILLASLFIFIFLFSFFSSCNFGYYLLEKNYDDFLTSINESLFPLIIILSILLSLALFILSSLALTLIVLITNKIPFYGYAYIPLNIFFLSFSSAIFGYSISYIFKRNNLFVLSVFIMFFIHFITFPVIDNNTIFSSLIAYLFLSIQLEKIWYWILSLNVSPMKSFYTAILYSSINLAILFLVFLAEYLFNNHKFRKLSQN